MANTGTNAAAGKRAGERFGDEPLRVVTAIGGLTGLLMILAGAALAAESGWAGHKYLPVILAAVGLLAAAFFVFHNFEWLALVISGRAALSGVLVGLMCAAAVAVWVAGAYFFIYKCSFKLPGLRQPVKLKASWDLTRSRLHTLSEESRVQLREIKNPLRFVVVCQPGTDSSGDWMLDELLKLYREASPQVRIEYLRADDKDGPRQAQELVKSLKSTKLSSPRELDYGYVAIFYGARDKLVRPSELWEYPPSYMMWRNPAGQKPVFKGEQVFTSAIYELMDEKKSKVYFAADHGERDCADRGRDGLSSAAEVLAGNNIETAVLHLRSAREIPVDADLLVVCGPEQALTAPEVEMLAGWVNQRRGRLLLCLDRYRPEVDEGLDPLLMSLGVAAGRDEIIEPNPDYVSPRFLNVYFARDFGAHPITEGLARARSFVAFYGARSISRMEGPGSQWEVTDLVTGSPESFGETDLALLAKGQARYDEGSDGQRPACYAVACAARKPPVPGMPVSQEFGRVAVFGDADWCTNGLIRFAPGNETLFASAINWLLGKESRITIEPKKADDDTGLNVKPRDKALAKYALWIPPLALLLVAGLLVWIRRR